MSDVVIKAENLSKYYKLGVINNGTMFRDIQTWLALRTGKEDPHSRIGEHKYDMNEDGFWALKNLNFEIHRGDRVGIIGKNGAGKSTLLKILSRITAPTEGKVSIKGRVASLLEVGTGFHAELTGRENIYMNGAILGMKKHEIDRKIDEIIAFSEIEKHIDTPVKRYSSGMYVRLGFAIAAYLESEILIADEVLAVGDAAFQKKALGKMDELSSGEGRTVFFVSHNMNQIRILCNKGIMLKNGSIAYDGDINNTIEQYFRDTNVVTQTNAIQFVQKDDNSYWHLNKIEILDENYKRVDGNLLGENKYIIRCDCDLDELPDSMGVGFSFFRDGQKYAGHGCTLNNVHTGKNIIDLTLPPKTMHSGCYDLLFHIDISLGDKNEHYETNLTFVYRQQDSFFELQQPD